MRNFSKAFVIFLFWAGIGIFFLYSTNAFVGDESLKSQSSPGISDADNDQNDAQFENAETIADTIHETSYIDDHLNDIDTLQTEVYTENSLLFDELNSSLKDHYNKKPVEKAEKSVPQRVKSPRGDIIYPRYSNGGLVMDKKLQQYANSIKEKLDTHTDYQLIIVGHTDNVGNDVDNYLIALERARQIKWYLTTRMGLDEDRVSAISKGETEPLFNNDTKAHRSKNNRIEVIIE
ncbi:OmpA family protein [Leeuwenhoekiella sp. A16]|uniref:OmpA family protein n=1 Tax=unclassified Leeuwenhoekiella TaxID=2615029 RepID=UPI003A7F6AD2